MAVVVGVVIPAYCVAEVKPLGPVHAYVAPDIVLADKVKALPEQTGVLLLAVGVAGVP